MKNKKPLLVLNEEDTRFFIGDSTIPGAGKGLFAKVPLRQGDLFPIIGVLVPSGSVSDEATFYADQHKFRVGNNLLIPVGFGALVNHSTNPHLEKIIQDDRAYFRVLRDVSAGEELFFTYSDYARKRFGLDQ